MEAIALYDQNFLLLQQVEGKLFVVPNRVAGRIQLREQVHGPLWLDAGDARNVVQHLPGQGALLVQASAGNDQLVNALIAAQCRLNRMLRRDVGTQAHVGEHLKPFDQVASPVFRTADDHPARAEAGGTIGLGQAVERDAQHIIGQ